MPPSVTFFRDGANRRPAGLPSGREPVRRAGDRLAPLRLTAVVRFWLNLKPRPIEARPIGPTLTGGAAGYGATVAQVAQAVRVQVPAGLGAVEPGTRSARTLHVLALSGKLNVATNLPASAASLVPI
jgi:hypothetical protein